nr:hypothetical protein [Tanacetum cinerariifolium]
MIHKSYCIPIKVHELDISSAELQEKVAAYKDFIGQLEKFQDEKMEEVNEKFDKLCANFVDMALHLEEKFYPHLLTTIFRRRWLLAHGMKLAIIRCLNSAEYMYALGAAVSKVVEKCMQEELSAGITHGAKDRKLADVTAYNPSAEADYLSALQRLQNVNFSLIAELKSNKDAGVDIIRNLLRLDDALAESASVLSLSLDVSHSRVRKIRENIASHMSAHRGVFVPLSEPLSATALEGMKDVTNESSADTDMEDASNQERMIVDLDRDEGIALMDDERAEKKLKMLSESVSAASATIAVVHAASITAAPVRVATASTRQRKGVVIRDPEEESTAKKPVETKSKDKGKGIMATPLDRKVPVVDYQIIHLNNKPRYKIIRADGTHQLAMFGRPDGQDQVWKSQKSIHGQAMVKSWKLLESCGVHIISFTTTQLILLVERRYLLLSFGVDAAIELEEKHEVFNAAGEELSAAKHKMMLLDTAAERRLMLLSQVKTINNKCYCCNLLMLLSETIHIRHLLVPCTKFFTSSIKHSVFFFKLHGSINSKANS